jgi:hypothetical protein
LVKLSREHRCTRRCAQRPIEEICRAISENQGAAEKKIIWTGSPAQNWISRSGLRAPNEIGAAAFDVGNSAEIDIFA